MLIWKSARFVKISVSWVKFASFVGLLVVLSALISSFCIKKPILDKIFVIIVIKRE